MSKVLTPDTSPFTQDTFLNGRLAVTQRQSGYRFSIDAILLSGFAQVKQHDRVVDLGCGCGIIALILAYHQPIQAFGVELQASLAEMASKNVTDNQLNDRVKIFQMDIKDLNQKVFEGPVDKIVCNPPFMRPASGRINPNTERALARHEITLTIEDVMATVQRILRLGGKFFVVFPAERMVDLFAHMRQSKVEPKRVRFVQSYAGQPGERILVEGIAGGRPGMRMEPPLVIYQTEGEYTREVRSFME